VGEVLTYGGSGVTGKEVEEVDILATYKFKWRGEPEGYVPSGFFVLHYD
jgi:hypothetical protein